MRLGNRGSLALTLAIVVTTVALLMVSLPPARAVLFCVAVGIVAAAFTLTLAAEVGWMPYVAAIANVVGAKVAASIWDVERGWPVVALMGVALSASLILHAITRRVRHRANKPALKG